MRLTCAYVDGQVHVGAIRDPNESPRANYKKLAIFRILKGNLFSGWIEELQNDCICEVIS